MSQLGHAGTGSDHTADMWGGHQSNPHQIDSKCNRREVRTDECPEEHFRKGEVGRVRCHRGVKEKGV